MSGFKLQPSEGVAKRTHINALREHMERTKTQPGAGLLGGDAAGLSVPSSWLRTAPSAPVFMYPFRCSVGPSETDGYWTLRVAPGFVNGIPWDIGGTDCVTDSYQTLEIPAGAVSYVYIEVTPDLSWFPVRVELKTSTSGVPSNSLDYATPSNSRVRERISFINVDGKPYDAVGNNLSFTALSNGVHFGAI